MTFGAAQCQRGESAAFDKTLGDVHRQKADVELARQQVLRVAGRTPVRHMQHESIGLQLEQLHGHVVRCSHAG